MVGIFPDDKALLRLSACVLIEAHDEWQVSDRRYLSEETMNQLRPNNAAEDNTRKELDTPTETVDQPALQPA